MDVVGCLSVRFLRDLVIVTHYILRMAHGVSGDDFFVKRKTIQHKKRKKKKNEKDAKSKLQSKEDFVRGILQSIVSKITVDDGDRKGDTVRREESAANTAESWNQ